MKLSFSVQKEAFQEAIEWIAKDAPFTFFNTEKGGERLVFWGSGSTNAILSTQGLAVDKSINSFKIDTKAILKTLKAFPKKAVIDVTVENFMTMKAGGQIEICSLEEMPEAIPEFPEALSGERINAKELYNICKKALPFKHEDSTIPVHIGNTVKATNGRGLFLYNGAGLDIEFPVSGSDFRGLLKQLGLLKNEKDVYLDCVGTKLYLHTNNKQAFFRESDYPFPSIDFLFEYKRKAYKEVFFQWENLAQWVKGRNRTAVFRLEVKDRSLLVTDIVPGTKAECGTYVVPLMEAYCETEKGFKAHLSQPMLVNFFSGLEKKSSVKLFKWDSKNNHAPVRAYQGKSTWFLMEVNV